MNQKRYLQELAYYLRSLPKDVQDELLMLYRNQFIQAENEGRSEEDTALLLGSPRASAEKELAIYAKQKRFYSKETVITITDGQTRSTNDQPDQPDQPINYLLLFILIGFNLIFVLGPVVGFFFAGIGMWASSIALMSAPLLAILFDGSLTFPEVYPILAAVGLGMLLFVAMRYVSQLAVRLTRAYFHAMNRFVRGN